MSESNSELAAWRKQMRAELLAQRDAIPLDQRRRDDALITQRLLAAFPQLARMIVGFYWPMKGEFDPRIAILRLREQGASAALPVVVKKAAPLEFHQWWPGIETKPGVFDLPVPQGSPVLVPGACLIPPVGFDDRGYRLGYGGGYFDRTLAALSPQPLKIAVGREMNRIATIRPQPYDIPMDFIVTEAGIREVTDSGLRWIARN